MNITRRRALLLAGVGLTTGLAGCSSNDIPDDAVESLASPTLGEADAPITIEVFEDYGCPHCKAFNESIAPQLLEDYVVSGVAKYLHRDYPIPVDRTWSWPVAMSARAVQDLGGDEAFWEYSSAIYQYQGAYNHARIESTAADSGLDGEMIVDETRANRYRLVVQADRDDATDRNASGTPAVFINGDRVQPREGRSYYAVIVDMIEQHR